MAVNFDVQERLTSAQEAVQSELNVLNQGLQKRQQAAKVKALLKLMQDTAHVMSKVGNMLSNKFHMSTIATAPCTSAVVVYTIMLFPPPESFAAPAVMCQANTIQHACLLALLPQGCKQTIDSG